MRWFLTGFVLFGLALAPALPLGAGPAEDGSQASTVPEGPSWDADGDRLAVVEVQVQDDHRFVLEGNASADRLEAGSLDRRARTVQVPDGAANASLAVAVRDAGGDRLVLVEGTSLGGELVNANRNGSGPVSSRVLVTVMETPATLVAEHWDLRERDGRATFTCPKGVVSQARPEYSNVGLRATVTAPVGTSAEVIYGRAEGCPGGSVTYAFLGLWTPSSASSS